jgi:hypothetical protein
MEITSMLRLASFSGLVTIGAIKLFCIIFDRDSGRPPNCKPAQYTLHLNRHSGFDRVQPHAEARAT